MKKRGHAVQYPPGVGGVMGKFYNMLLDDGHVDSKLLGKVFDSCPTLHDKVHFLNAVLLQPSSFILKEFDKISFTLNCPSTWRINIGGITERR